METNIDTPPIKIEFRHDGQLHIITINSMKRDAVDQYIEIIDQHIMKRKHDLLMSVHDYRNLGGTITPYFLGSMKKFSQVDRREVSYGRVALITNNEMFRLLFNPVVKVLLHFSNGVEIQFFGELDKGVEWVQSYER